VDAESNLRSSRRQLDKLRDLRSEEMEVTETIKHLVTTLTPLRRVVEFRAAEKREGAFSKYSDPVHFLISLKLCMVTDLT
jgi:hypothetical protein